MRRISGHRQETAFIKPQYMHGLPSLPLGMGLLQRSTDFVVPYIFAAHRHRQVGQLWSRADPQEKAAAHLHDVKMNQLLQNLLGEIVHRDALTRRLISHSVHCVKLLLPVANNDHFDVNAC